jgi:hypothetical protein
MTHVLAIRIATEEFELRSARPQGVKLSYLEASETHGFLEEELYDLRQEHNLIPPTSISEALHMAGKKASSKAGTTHPSKEGEEFSLVPVATNLQHMLNQLWLLTPLSPGATPSIEIVASRLQDMFHWICLLPYAVLTYFVQLYLSWSSNRHRSIRKGASAQDSAPVPQHSSLDPPTDQEIKLPQIHTPEPDQQPKDTDTPSQSSHPRWSTPLRQCFQIDPAIKFLLHMLNTICSFAQSLFSIFTSPS